MNNTIIDRICTLVALGIMTVSLFFCGYCRNQTKMAEARLMEIECQVYSRLEETEEKCQRYCDTCIDILANKRWE